MIISLIVAMDEAGGIGKGGALPWHLNADLRRFKALTIGHHILMGRKTYESIGKPLPGRMNVVISRDAEYVAEGCQVVNSLEDALALASSRSENEVFIIGGSEIFAQALPLADRLYLTRVHALLDCDTFFPAFEAQTWKEVTRDEYPQDAQNQYASTYYLYNRQV